MMMRGIAQQERYWIQKLDTYRTGYNQNRGGEQSFSKYDNVLIVEAKIIVDSCEYLGREIVRITDWAGGYVFKQIKNLITFGGERKVTDDPNLK